MKKKKSQFQDITKTEQRKKQNSLFHDHRQSIVSIEDDDPENMNMQLSMMTSFQFPTSKKQTKLLSSIRLRESSSGERCSQCQYQGEMETVLKLGWVGYSWIVVLFLSTVIFFWIPMVADSFKQKQVVCPQCGHRIKIQRPSCL